MFNLIDLPYSPKALEPVISAKTLEFHHGKHLQGYVDNLNKLIAGTEYEGKTLEEIVLSANGTNQALFNNAGQTLNHNLYFTQFQAPGKKPGTTAALTSNGLVAQILKQWGTMEAFQAEFESKGAGLFGSGWVWLSAQKDGTLVITQEPGANNPILRPDPTSKSGQAAHLKPILTFDVWEHAYYLDYQNRRPAHLAALWQLLDWEILEKRYAQAKKQ